MKPYIYKGWLGHWFVLFPSNKRLQFDTWADAVHNSMKRNLCP